MSETGSISLLLGCTLINVDGLHVGSEYVTLLSDCGGRWHMYHSQDCCESVSIEDVVGDVEDLLGSPILLAEERKQETNGDDDLCMWTFYTIATIKGTVDIRWMGTSNGYYSVGVSVEEMQSVQEALSETSNRQD